MRLLEPTSLVPPSFPAFGVRKRVLAAACQLSGVPEGTLVGNGRGGELPRLRWAAMVALRHAGFSTPQIGKMLGGRDHTTVMHGLKQADIHRLKTPGYDEFCRALIAVVDGRGAA